MSTSPDFSSSTLTDLQTAQREVERLQQAIATALSDHWQTTQLWGGETRLACGRCAYSDGVRFLWPCPTRQALTGEAAPKLTPSPLAAPVDGEQ